MGPYTLKLQKHAEKNPKKRFTEKIKNSVLKKLEKNYMPKFSKWFPKYFVRDLINSYGDVGLTSSINRTIREFKESKQEEYRKKTRRERNDSDDEFDCIGSFNEVPLALEDVEIRSEAWEAKQGQWSMKLCTHGNLSTHKGKRVCKECRSIEKTQRKSKVTKPHLCANKNVRKIYYKYAELYARQMRYLTGYRMHQVLANYGIQTSIYSVQRHLKYFFKAKTQYYTFNLKITSPKMPFLELTSENVTVETCHPNHPDHESKYVLHLSEDSERILVWPGIEKRVKPMPASFLARHTHWSDKYTLNGNPNDYQLIPKYSENPCRPRPHDFSNRQREEWMNEFKPTVN
jgi:hypothetical protein